MDELQQRVENKYKNQFITVSNAMIRSRENTTLLESKIEALAMFYMGKEVRQSEKTDANGNKYNVNYVCVPVREISQLMPRSYGSHVDGKTYDEIKNAAISMKQKLFIIEDRENNRFIMKNMYGDIIYDDGKLYIEFEPSMEKYFIGLKQNFSKLKLPVLFSFKKNGGFQLYKLLKSYAYPPNLPDINMSLRQEDMPKYSVYWSLTDLRMEMGYVDISQPLLKKEGMKPQPDWQKMENAEKEPRIYKRWSDMYIRVINPGVEEINKLSDIYICDITKEAVGRGGKVTGVTFTIQHNKAYYEKQGFVNTFKAEPTEEQKDELIDDLLELFDEKIKFKDIKSIAEAGNYDFNNIRRVYMLSKKNDIDDIVGWMISGLKEGYTEPVKNKRNNQFNSFKQRTYDFEQLEKEAISF